MQDNNYNYYLSILLKWHKNNERHLPWKTTKDPYLTWLSEIILQQTQVAQGLPYYKKFSKAFPSVKHLANAELSEIMKLWEGLGYYSRARNLHHTAKQIVTEHNNKFPDTYEGLLKLKGVGAYTAAAIASFAFDKPHAVVDGNVFRFLSRLFGIKKPIDNSEGKKYFNELANKLLDKKYPAAYNQAVMNFGSMVCTPKQPLCYECPFAKQCVAYKKNEVSLYPVKLKKLTKKTRYFNYLFIQYKNSVYLNHRTANDIWKNLYDLPVIESSLLLSEKQLIKTKEWKIWFKDIKTELINSTDLVQQLSHQTIYARFYKILTNNRLGALHGFNFIDINEIDLFAYPKIIRDYMKTL